MMAGQRTNAREKILAAAADVAREAGPGSVSLDAVAHRAGVSKGGLLYHFPSKAKLMQALVEHYLAEFQASLDQAQASGESLLAAFVKRAACECEEKKPASANWIFSAIAQDPDFLSPMKAFHRQLFARLKEETGDLRAVLICYLAIEGLRSMNLFDFDVLSDEERHALIASLLTVAQNRG
jgi:AcrR family transcriptional regulator